MTEINKKRIEFDTTGQHFGLGVAWSGYPRYEREDKFIAIILGCLVIRINFAVKQLPTKK